MRTELRTLTYVPKWGRGGGTLGYTGTHVYLARDTAVSLNCSHVSMMRTPWIVRTEFRVGLLAHERRIEHQ